MEDREPLLERPGESKDDDDDEDLELEFDEWKKDNTYPSSDLFKENEKIKKRLEELEKKTVRIRKKKTG